LPALIKAVERNLDGLFLFGQGFRVSRFQRFKGAVPYLKVAMKRFVEGHGFSRAVGAFLSNRAF
jgi:hypothetical protein